MEIESRQLDSRKLGRPCLAGANRQGSRECAGGHHLPRLYWLEPLLGFQDLEQVRGDQKRTIEHIRTTSLRLHRAILCERDREGTQLRNHVSQSVNWSPRTDHQGPVKSKVRDGISRPEFPVGKMTLDDLV